MTTPVPVLVKRKNRNRRPEMATQWQLMWWKFKKHQMAMVGIVMLSLLVFSAVFAEFLSPEIPSGRNNSYLASSPMGIHFFDANWDFHLRPFVYARSTTRDPVTLRKLSVVDETQRWPIEFFVSGSPYKFWGLFKTDVHLFGAKGGFVHLFGTDSLGRDVFSRTLYATRISLSVGLVGVTFAFILGAIIGGIAGYFGGIVDNVIMRLIEFIRSIPTLPLWLALSAALPREWSSLQVYLAITVILAMVGWTHLARTVRSKLLALREEDFTVAARLSGCTDMRIILRHLLPSFMSYMIVDVTIAFPEILLAETSLSFLGLGLREPAESWGVLLFAAQNVRSISHMPWLLIPGLFIVIAVLAFNFVGDGMRDAADPYSK
ncbi:MAG: peptide/nickel transport system permease protein [Parasphingorhabdus sp.]|jgi:peptide/nickel transport system permease protein